LTDKQHASAKPVEPQDTEGHSPSPSSVAGPKRLPKDSQISNWFWGGFFAIILTGAVFTIFAAIRGAQSVAVDVATKSGIPPPVTEAIRVIVAPGESVLLDAAALGKAHTKILEHLAAKQTKARQALEATLDQELERIFGAADRQVPAFADWYYSLTGEYMRLFNAAFGDLSAFLAERLDELVFGPAGTAQAIDTLSASLGEESIAGFRNTLGEVQELLLELVRENGLTTERVHVTGEWDLSSQLGPQLQPYLTLTPEDLARQGVAASAGAAAGAAAAKKLGGTTVAKAAGKLAAKPAAGAAGALAAKIGLKSAAKAGGTLGSAGTGAAAGAAICAGTVVGAPLSPGCALIGGAVSGLAAWLLVDKAVIEADEYLHRAELEEGLRVALAEQRVALRAEFETRYLAGADAVLEQIRSDLETGLSPRPIAPKRDFIPARAATRDRQ